MANSCPKCTTNVEHDFGVFVCTKCGAVLFVDFDGNVQLSSPEDAAQVSETADQPISIPELEPLSFETEPESFQLSELEEAAPESEILAEADPSIEPVAEPIADPAAESASENAQNMAWFDQGVDDALNAEPQAPAAAQSTVTEVNFQDVADYANQMELDNSPLVYTLWIEGIDRKEVRLKVIEVLKDVKFNLHLKELIPTIRGGVLEIRDLNPVKTSLIATRLREESVTFRWKQNVFQSEAASGT